MTKRIIYRNIVILFIILITFSILDGFIKIPTSVLMLFMIISSFIYKPAAFVNKQTIFLLLYFLVLVINFLGLSTFINIPWIAQEFLIPFSCLSIINVLLYTRDFAALKTITFAGVFIILILSIPTIILLQVDPDLLRNTISATDLSSDYLSALSASGLVRYGIIQAVPFLFAFFVLFIINQKKVYIKFVFIVFLAIEYYLLVKASFATSIIIATIAIVLALINSTKKNKMAFTIFGLLIAFIFFNKDLIVNFLTSIQPSFENTAIYDKITDINSSLVEGSTDGEVAGRQDLYDKSLDSFFANPFFGSSYKLQGGHSYFIDRLSYFGIFGALPFFLFLYYTFKNHYMMISKGIKFYYLIGVCAFLILGIAKNISGIEPFLYVLVFLPGLAFSFPPKVNYLSLNTKSKSIYNNSSNNPNI